jgi:selenocysteine lyase/cysteine desulfurase
MNRRQFAKSISLGVPSAFLLNDATASELGFPIAPSGPPGTVAADEGYWSRVRDLFVIKAKAIPMSNGPGGPAPQAILDRLAEITNSEAQWRTELWEDLAESGSSPPLRARMASTFGADAGEVTLTRNCMDGLATILFGLDLRKGDEVVTSDQDYDSAIDILRQREQREGIKLRLIKLPPVSQTGDDTATIVSAFEGGITSRTRAILLCHMYTNTGQVLPVREICRMARRHGVFSVVDGAHAPGHLDFRIADLECDSFAGSLHKWFMAPRGTGILYIRKDRIADIWPHTYWPSRDVPRESIEKFDYLGTINLAVPAVLPMVFDFNDAVGAANREARLRYLKSRVFNPLAKVPRVRILTDQRPQRSCGMSAFAIDGMDRHAVKKSLQEIYGVYVRTYLEGEDPALAGVNVGPSLINSSADCDRLVESVASLVARS